MQFTRLRLTGFKSFVDPTELVIQPGLTGIVGPNGCGKSNLIEALRWVMGETSPKSMRGGGMEDVIFAGTTNRPARNFAEVLLQIDNTERDAPAAFNDSALIEVSRRIERDAGSAYRVNGMDVRARDVQLLFADMASGAHSPSMVSQGRVGALISAKPQDRRAIMEEAAGITGLHSRRHEAELRLSAAESNIQRLDDIMHEIEVQYNMLKRQSRQATRYKNLSGLIRAAEAIYYHIRWTGTSTELAAAERNFSEIEVTVQEATRSAASASSTQAEAASHIPALRDREAAEAAKLHRLTIERENLDAEARRAEETATTLTARLTQISADIDREEALNRDAVLAVERMDAETRSLEAAGTGQDDAEEEARADAERAIAALTASQNRYDDASSGQARADADRISLDRQIVDSEQRIQRLTTELEESRSERLKVLAETAGHGISKELLDQIDQARTAAQNLQKSADATELERIEAQQAEQLIRDTLRNQEADLARTTGEIEALDRLISASHSDLWPPMIDAVSVKPGYETAMGAALGDDLGVPADEAAPVHWSMLKIADTDGAGLRLPAGVVALSNFVEGPAALQSRLRQIGVVSEEDGPRLRSLLKQGQRLVSKEGSVWRWDGYTATSEAVTSAATRLAQRNRLEELRGLEAEKELEVNEARSALDEAQRASHSAMQAEAAARQNLRDAEDRLSGIRDQHAALMEGSAERQSRVAALDQSIETLIAAIQEQREMLSASTLALSELPGETAAKEDTDEARRELDAAGQAAGEARSAYEGFRREAAAREARLQSIRQEREAWQDRSEGAIEQLSQLKDRRQEAQSQLEELKSVPQQIEEKRGALLGALEAADQERDTAADQLATAEAGLAEADKAQREAQASLAEFREERVRLEAQVSQIGERRSELAARIREALHAAPDDVLSLAELKENQDLPTFEEIEHRVGRLKRERENMGAVNLRADAEATELDERLQGMQAERTDLEAAIARLRQGIGSLNREGRDRLLSAFNDVNEHFSTLFTQLFGGGRAHLTLTESDDPLESGLEIMASPPGKKLQTMSLLSGGEQALTALALIFAVFLTNPAPVCVLDEVDAPLDDSNVLNFCALLDEIAANARTRFLVVSHHQITMSRMDRLFGVTMGERGVSQLVSVDLERAAQLRAAE